MIIITLLLIVGNILLYFREYGATPLGCVNAQADSDREYECVDDNKCQYPLATQKVDDVDLEQCPAYMPTTFRNQSPVDAATEGQYEDVL